MMDKKQMSNISQVHSNIHSVHHHFSTSQFPFYPYNVYPFIQPPILPPNQYASNSGWAIPYPQSYYYEIPMNNEQRSGSLVANCNYFVSSLKQNSYPQVIQEACPIAKQVSKNRNNNNNKIKVSNKKNNEPLLKHKKNCMNKIKTEKKDVKEINITDQNLKDNDQTYVEEKMEEIKKIVLEECNEENNENALSNGNENILSNGINVSTDLTSSTNLFLFGIRNDIEMKTLKESLERLGGISILNVYRLNNVVIIIEVENFNIAKQAIETINGQKMENSDRSLILTLSTESSIKICEKQLKILNMNNMNQDLKNEKEENIDNNKQIIEKKDINIKNNSVKLLIEGLPRKIDYEDLFNVFSRYGRVENIQIVKSWKNKSENFANVVYSKKSMALNAIRCLDGHYKIHDSIRPLSLKLCN